MKNFLANIWSGARAGSSKIFTYAKNHKVITGIVLLVIVGIGYWGISSAIAANKPAQYVVTNVTQGTLETTVTDSGTVSAEHQLSLSPKASGTVTGVYATAGQAVKAGTLIATIDASDANDSIRTAQQNLTSAQITYKQALTSAQNTTQNDQTSLRTANTNAFNSIASTYSQTPTVMNGLDSILHDMSTVPGYTAEQNLDAYANYINTAESRAQHDKIIIDYKNATDAYAAAENAYAAYDVTTATPKETEQLAATTQTALQKINTLTRDTLTFLNYINGEIIRGQRTAPSALTGNISSTSGYLSTITSQVTSIQSSETSLINAEQSVTSDTQTLEGSNESLAIQSAQLNLQKAQDALAQAQKNAQDYVVRAPFDGTIGSVSIKKYDSASSGTAVAVLVTKENYVNLSVNEADASQLEVGQKASITFDAIDGLVIDGTVAEVDQVGTVSQGVATYTVKIGFDTQDDRIKPGMTAEATITTASVADAIQVPSSAIHTTGNTSYVEVAVPTASSTMSGPRMNTVASSSARFRMTGGMASTTSSTTGFRVGTFSRSMTLSADAVKITRVPVTVGISNDTMVQITNGLSRGQLVVTQTITSSGKNTSSSTGGLFGARRTPTTGATTGTRTGTNATFRAGGAVGGATFRAGPGF